MERLILKRSLTKLKLINVSNGIGSDKNEPNSEFELSKQKLLKRFHMRSGISSVKLSFFLILNEVLSFSEIYPCIINYFINFP